MIGGNKMARKTIAMRLPPRIVRIVFHDVEVINVDKPNARQKPFKHYQLQPAVNHLESVGQ